MRFISFPFHGLEQLVEYNRNSPTVKRFLPIYANRCTRYPHYESPPAKTRSFPQHCQCTGKRCFQQFIGGSKTRVATSSGDVFPAVRTHRYEKKSKRESPLMLAGDAKSSSSNEGAFGNPREIAREARSTDPGSTYPQHMKDSSGKPRRVMKRHSTKTDLAANRRSGKEGNALQNPHLTAENPTSPHRAIPAIVENVENLEFIRKSRWKNIETRGFQLLKNCKQASA